MYSLKQPEEKKINKEYYKIKNVKMVARQKRQEFCFEFSRDKVYHTGVIPKISREGEHRKVDIVQNQKYNLVCREIGRAHV